MAVDKSNNVYVADQLNNLIRKITPDGTVSTLAGTGTVGFANGTGTQASFDLPTWLKVDALGNVFVSDLSNHTIRKITPAGVVTTVAGSGTGGLANGVGTQASFDYPQGIAMDMSGNLFVADSQNNLIREVETVGYQVSPVLPSGLSINGNGIISGTPTVASAATNYTVNAFNAAGSSSATISIAVSAVAGSGIITNDAMVIYPNPASSATSARVKYRLSVNSDVTISIYNKSGRLLSSFKTSAQTAGEHENAIETSELNLGVYVVTITANGYNKIGKLTVQ